MNNIQTHCGHIAIIGRSNVGKSTLINKIIEKKISITARKTQTTRHRTIGIKTNDNYQFIYIDTPGISKIINKKLNKYMNDEAINSFLGVDIILLVVAGTIWQSDDNFVLQTLKTIDIPIILIINKIDLVSPKKLLLEYIKEISVKKNFSSIIPLSAKNNINIDLIEKEIKKLLPISNFLYPIDQKTVHNDKFLASEIIREKLIRFLGQELPYSIAVIIDDMHIALNNILVINATIYVERHGQKIIVIGNNGMKLKEIGSAARHDLEILFLNKVFLKLWVKVKKNWTQDEKSLFYLEYRKN